jgi:hypothetical protein
MGPYARVHRDYKYTSEYALLERKKQEAENEVKPDGLESKCIKSHENQDDSKKIV